MSSRVGASCRAFRRHPCRRPRTFWHCPKGSWTSKRLAPSAAFVRDAEVEPRGDAGLSPMKWRLGRRAEGQCRVQQHHRRAPCSTVHVLSSGPRTCSVDWTGHGARFAFVNRVRFHQLNRKTKGPDESRGRSITRMGHEPAVVSERPFRPTRLSLELEEVVAATKARRREVKAVSKDHASPPTRHERAGAAPRSCLKTITGGVRCLT